MRLPLKWHLLESNVASFNTYQFAWNGRYDLAKQYTAFEKRKELHKCTWGAKGD
jgi:hypothetical protein